MDMYLIGLLGETLGMAFISLFNPLAWVTLVWNITKKADCLDVGMTTICTNVISWYFVAQLTNDYYPSLSQNLNLGQVMVAAAFAGLVLASSGCLIRHIVNSMFKKPDIHFYRIAMQEIESGQLEKGNWAKALVSTQGDEFRARTAYIKLRVKELTGAQP